jgi:hypothetical protein
MPLSLGVSANGGSWTITGTVRMNGVLGVSGTAQCNNLQFGLAAFGSETPEASTLRLFAIGLATLIAAGYWKRDELVAGEGEGVYLCVQKNP